MMFMMMHRTDAYYEAGGLPSQELIANVGRMVGEAVQAGTLRAADGLRSSALGARLEFKGGRRTVTRGPLKGGNELIAGFTVLRAKSLDEAIEWGARIGQALGGAEIDVRPATEPWDIGVGEKPAWIDTVRYIAMRKADAQSEAGVPPTPAQRAALDAVHAEMRAAGVLLSTGTLGPSAGAARLRNFGGRQTLTDGPFAESKELVGGFVVLEFGSMHEAVDWARRYVEVLGEVEMDVLPVVELSA